MSWDGYIDHLMVDLPHGGNLTSSAILGLDGGVWASSPAFPPVTPDQVAALVAAFQPGEAGLNALGQSGIRLGDLKFQLAPGDESVLRGKMKDGGCCIKRTAQTLVVGIYTAPVTPADCNVVVEKLGDYLVEMSY